MESRRRRRAGRQWAWRIATVGFTAHFLAVQVVAQSYSRSIGTPLVIAELGSVDAHAEDVAKRAHAQFALDADALGLTPSSDIGLSQLGDHISVATTMASAPVNERPLAAYFVRREVFSVDLAQGATDVAQTDTIAAIEEDVASLEIVTRFHDDFDELSPKRTRLSGVLIRRLFEIEVAGLSDAIEALGEEAGPEQVAGIFEELGVAEHPMEETITVEYPDGTILSGEPGDAQLNGFFGGGAAEDCIGSCLNSIGAPVAVGLVTCLVAGTVGCGFACVLSAGIACVPCVGAVVTGCGAVGGTAGPIACVIYCVFGGPRPPTATPTRTRPAPTPTPDRRTFSVEADRLRVASGGEIEISWTAPSGTSGGKDWFGLYSPDAANLEYLSYRYLENATSGNVVYPMPATPGLYEIRLLVNNGYFEPVPAHRIQIEVVAPVTGDCNQDGSLDISDLITGVNIALGRTPFDTCPSLDRNANGRLEISELVAAVQALLGG